MAITAVVGSFGDRPPATKTTTQVDRQATSVLARRPASARRRSIWPEPVESPAGDGTMGAREDHGIYSGFNGIYSGFNGDLMGSNGILMGFTLW